MPDDLERAPRARPCKHCGASILLVRMKGHPGVTIPVEIEWLEGYVVLFGPDGNLRSKPGRGTTGKRAAVYRDHRGRCRV
jgi:hypothetical protein